MARTHIPEQKFYMRMWVFFRRGSLGMLGMVDKGYFLAQLLVLVLKQLFFSK